MKILLLSDSKVGERRFIESLRVNGNPLFHSINNGIAIKREREGLDRVRDTTVYDTVRGTYRDWWTGDTNYDVYLRLEARGVK